MAGISGHWAFAFGVLGKYFFPPSKRKIYILDRYFICPFYL